MKESTLTFLHLYQTIFNKYVLESLFTKYHPTETE